MAEHQTSLLRAKNVSVAFKIRGEYITAVSNVDLTVKPGEVYALVGESGSGKSTLATAMIGLHDPAYTKVTGDIQFETQDLLKLTNEEWPALRGNVMSMIFQDPLSALNPLQKIGDQIKEALMMHDVYPETAYDDRVLDLLNSVGINHPKWVANEFPHQLSGGMRQRVVIAIAVANKPRLIIADEPTTALDVTIQAQILDLLKTIQKENSAGILLITHDLGVVAEVADTVGVMYAGQIVEQAPVAKLFEAPKHPYTRSLLRSIPTLDQQNDDLYVIAGSVPSLKKMDHRRDMFLDRIPWIDDDLRQATNVSLNEVSPEHFVRGTAWQTFRFAEEK
ncbi:ABC transporter ATP-binding protein [Weissella diestrammenae]|uniref:ABC transporter ATP-binding protein n=1 Tax=Weissella diestrammenae TaxID=1162633 RepID=A0A7G9T3N9_9LACO|nr:ABC transporter ATP-binding protein [Weissella diestrammenae]MCM0582694.1 ABC transporter ATP-binding protein [Weissella diestrammenae]QNN74714.1 ABC transporter ATP-binding protein [Weissella diestrammenae]